MIISLIVAMDLNGGIGLSNGLPWRLKDDLKRFRALTWGHDLIMGRKTFESIGKPLPGRTMIIVTRQGQYEAPGCLIVHSVEEALALAVERGQSEVFVIGGATIYEQLLSSAEKIYLTRVQAHLPVDVFFPEIDPTQWVEHEHSRHPANEHNEYPFTCSTLIRKKRE